MKCKFLIISQYFRHITLSHHVFDGAKINIGGRQRMLSKKFSMETTVVLLGCVGNDTTVVKSLLANVDDTRALWVASQVVKYNSNYPGQSVKG
jgi:hypothetical protein